MAVYILKFDAPIGGHARYYVGYCADRRFNARMREHAKGRGARLTQVALERGIGWKLCALFDGAGRDVERKIKASKNTPRLIRRWQRQGIL